MNLSAAEIHAIGEAAKSGKTVAASIFLNLVKVLHDKTYLSNTRETCFKFLAALAENGQQLPDDAFDAFLLVLRDVTEVERLRRIAAFVLIRSLADGHKHSALMISRRDSYHLGLSEVLEKDPNLFIRACVACALPYVLDKGSTFPEFLEFYLQDAHIVYL